jgi:hypothetical protein
VIILISYVLPFTVFSNPTSNLIFNFYSLFHFVTIKNFLLFFTQKKFDKFVNEHRIVSKEMRRMNEKQMKTLTFGRRMTSLGLFVGFIVFLTSFFASGVKQDYIFSIGLSIMVSSMLLFGFGLFLMLMQGVSDARQKV